MEVGMGTTLRHGAYEQRSRYTISQLRYAASQVSFVEVLRIHDGPADKHPLVVYDYRPREGGGHHGRWFECRDEAVTLRVFDRIAGQLQHTFDDIPGIIRVTPFREQTPWFFAALMDTIMGDYATADI